MVCMATDLTSTVHGGVNQRYVKNANLYTQTCTQYSVQSSPIPCFDLQRRIKEDFYSEP